MPEQFGKRASLEQGVLHEQFFGIVDSPADQVTGSHPVTPRGLMIQQVRIGVRMLEFAQGISLFSIPAFCR
jgi:hypothetical protein